MSKRARIKVKKPMVRKPKSPKSYQPPKRYTSFNIFTKYGDNLVVASNRPMTLEEAQYHYKALSISGND